MAHTRFSPSFTGKPLVYAHRGSSLRAPENTMKAFALGLDEGADGVELDVRRCASGEVVVAHDADLMRVAGVRGRIVDLTFQQLAEHDVGSGEHIPRLDDVLDLIVSRGAVVNVEIKADDDNILRLVRSVAHVLTRRARKDRDAVLISTFHPIACALVRTLMPDLPVGFLYEDNVQGRLLSSLTPRLLRVAAVHPNFSLVNETSIAQARRRGFLTNVWTVDDPAEARRLASLRVDGLITNDVRKIREALLNP